MAWLQVISGPMWLAGRQSDHASVGDKNNL
jgi:hypothetical protein